MQELDLERKQGHWWPEGEEGVQGYSQRRFLLIECEIGVSDWISAENSCSIWTCRGAKSYSWRSWTDPRPDFVSDPLFQVFFCIYYV